MTIDHRDGDGEDRQDKVSPWPKLAAFGILIAALVGKGISLGGSATLIVVAVTIGMAALFIVGWLVLRYSNHS